MQTKFYSVNLQIHYNNVIYLTVVATLRLEKSRRKIYVLPSIICSTHVLVFVKHCARPLLKMSRFSQILRIFSTVLILVLRGRRHNLSKPCGTLPSVWPALAENSNCLVRPYGTP